MMALLKLIDAEQDRWRRRENKLSGTQDLYAIGEAAGAQRALRLLREQLLQDMNNVPTKEEHKPEARATHGH